MEQSLFDLDGDTPGGGGLEFEDWWAVYPRRSGKGAARKAFAKALGKVSGERLLAATVAYAFHPDLPELQYVPHPATWLNQERWDDDPPPPRVESGKRGRYDDLLSIASGQPSRGLDPIPPVLYGPLSLESRKDQQ